MAGLLSALDPDASFLCHPGRHEAGQVATTSRNQDPLLSSCKELDRVHAQCPGQLVQRPHRDVLLAALDGPDVGAVQTGPGPKLFLRPAALVAEPANGSGDDLARAGRDHGQDDVALLLLARQSIPSTIR